MGMTERDQKVLAFVVAFVVLGGFWFLVVHKKQGAIKTAQEAQVAAQTELDAAKAQQTQALNVAKVKPAAYSRLLRLGKAIPADKDFESLLVQVNDISVDSKVNFVSLTTAPSAGGAAVGASGATTCDVTGATGGATDATGAAAPTGASGSTGSTAQTWVGQDRDKAEAAVATNDAANASTEAAAEAVSCANSPSLTDIAATAAGLSAETYSFTFTGSFYSLKDVYNGLLDMVEVNNGRVKVTGRLLDINSIAMSVTTFPDLTAAVSMTGYKLAGATTPNGAEVPGTTPAGTGNLTADTTAKADAATGESPQ
ncbi:MAG: hypothetical protein JHD02_01645 [Thermoleophilaceae bacterium]|nr:hypothetical protein [Thermoleophilaceae bacterium]